MKTIQDEKQKALLLIPPKRIQTILDELANLRDRANKGEDVTIPLTTLHLKNGKDITGWFLGMEYDRNEQCLLFQICSSDYRSYTYDIAYLYPASIEAMTVHNAAEVAHLISFGKVAVPPGTPAPTKLELKHKARDLAEAISEALGVDVSLEVDWNVMPDYDEVFIALSTLMNDCAGVIMELASEEFARDIMAKRLQRITFVDAVEPKVKLEEGVLTISSALSGEEKGRFSRFALKEAIESLF